MTAPIASELHARIASEGQAFSEWLDAWYSDLSEASFDEIFPDVSRGAIVTVDLLVGFCREGPLAADRVDSLVGPTVELLTAAHDRGLRRFLFANDAHEPDAPEFEAWPQHCVKGTFEAELVEEINRLPFADKFIVFEKNALSPGLNPDLSQWLEANDEVRDYLVVGDCTDLCVYQMAMFLRMWANTTNRANKRVWVSASLVNTYDLPVRSDVPMPHPGDFIHALFLYHMALNGICVIKSVRY